jgi:tRNA nucleotidyltransferase (CCA-adding enzyme)
LGLIETCDGLRKPERFELLLRTAVIVTELDISLWLQKLRAVRGVDAGSIAAGLKDPSVIKTAVRQARLAALT